MRTVSVNLLSRHIRRATGLDRRTVDTVLDVEAGVMSAQGMSRGHLFGTGSPAGQQLDEDTICRFAPARLGVGIDVVERVLAAELEYLGLRGLTVSSG